MSDKIIDSSDKIKDESSDKIKDEFSDKIKDESSDDLLNREIVFVNTTNMTYTEEQQAIKDAKEKDPDAMIFTHYTTNIFRDLSRVEAGLGYYDIDGRYRPNSYSN